MAGNRHNECNSGIISTLKTYHTISLFQFSLILLLAYICAVLFIVMGMHMVFRSDHSGQRTQPDCLNVLHVCKPALACYTVTSGRTDPESWPRVESTDLLKPCQAEGMRWFLRVCVCVCHGTEMWSEVVLLVQCILVEIKIISNLCEWDLQGE